MLIHSFATVESVDLPVALSGSDFAEIARSPSGWAYHVFPNSGAEIDTIKSNNEILRLRFTLICSLLIANPRSVQNGASGLGTLSQIWARRISGNLFEELLLSLNHSDRDVTQANLKSLDSLPRLTCSIGMAIVHSIWT